MNPLERIRLLFAPYRPPCLRRGDRAFCLLRDCDVVITGWSDARIPWPRCRALGARGGGSGLLVDAELARAIRTESAAALRYSWGVNPVTVFRWRKALGVTRIDCLGSQRLIRAASQAGAALTRGRRLPADQVERRRRTAVAMKLGRHLRPGYQGRWWTRREKNLLGKAPDAVIASRIGRTATAVRVMRTRLGIPNAADGRRRR